MLSIKQFRIPLLSGLVLLWSVAAAFAAPTFTREGGVTISSATPQFIDISTAPWRLYFLRGGFEVRSATGSNGLDWSEEDGIRLSTSSPGATAQSITGCSALPLDTPGYRMLCALQLNTTSWVIISATSTQGVDWTVESGVRIATATSFMGSPRLVELTNGNWRLYYTRDSNGGNNAVDRRIFSSLSTDQGVTWGASTLMVDRQIGEVGASLLTGGQVRLYYTVPGSSNLNTDIRSALSDNESANNFGQESGTRLSTTAASGELSFPLPFRSTDTFRFRLLYGYTAVGVTFPSTLNSLTLAPDPQSITPNSGVRSDATTTVAISGDIFSSTPTVALVRSGEVDIVGTSISRIDDRTIIATFATLDQTIGQWHVVVTNNDGVTGTLTNGFTVSFSAGTVSLVDNLLRPRDGNKTLIQIQIFEAGSVHVEIFTLDAKLVRTVFDGNAPLGPLNVEWNGTNDQNNVVASGTYLVRVSGPKLDSVQKIVVIR